MADKNIVILGGSWAGISSAHYFLKNISSKLTDGSSYKVVMISPSPDMWHRVGGPRAIIAKNALPEDKILQSISKYFSSYPAGSFTLIEGIATGLNADARTVDYKSTTSGEAASIAYHALIIGTGVRCHLDAWNNVDKTSVLEGHLDDIRAKIAAANSIIIGGGGPAGVETAGEIGSVKNGEPGFFAGVNKSPKHSITILTSDTKLLPTLRPSLASRAEYFLNRLGVTVQYNSRIDSVSESKEDGQTTVTLTSGQQLTADLYISALGVTPNTSFLPAHVLNDKGKVDSNSALRVPSAGARVYAIGDVGAHVQNGSIMAVIEQVPVLMTNLHRDLEAYASATDEKVDQAPGPDRLYVEDLKENMMVPVGRSKAVGAFAGWKAPSFLLWLLKGRDYMLWFSGSFTLPGKLMGEKKWTPPKA